jgi:hypothetical protein
MDEMAETTDSIVANLHAINADETNLDELEDTTDDIVKNLGVIAKADVA